MPTRPPANDLAFQFTLPCRERLPSSVTSQSRRRFQFTLPCRERPDCHALFYAKTAGFNSRSRVGSDILLIIVYLSNMGFNSRSRVGSDRSLATSSSWRTSFNSRSRVGSDNKAYLDDYLKMAFQFTLPCRERLRIKVKHINIGVCFNSRSRVGSDRRCRSASAGRELFQFTLPCRERRERKSARFTW